MQVFGLMPHWKEITETKSVLGSFFFLISSYVSATRLCSFEHPSSRTADSGVLVDILLTTAGSDVRPGILLLFRSFSVLSQCSVLVAKHSRGQTQPWPWCPAFETAWWDTHTHKKIQRAEYWHRGLGLLHKLQQMPHPFVVRLQDIEAANEDLFKCNMTWKYICAAERHSSECLYYPNRLLCEERKKLGIFLLQILKAMRFDFLCPTQYLIQIREDDCKPRVNRWSTSRASFFFTVSKIHSLPLVSVTNTCYHQLHPTPFSRFVCPCSPARAPRLHYSSLLRC